MNELLLHDTTRQAVSRLLAKRVHAIVLTGPAGSGKSTLAGAIARDVLGKASLDREPYYRRYAPVDNTVTIEQMRDAQKFLALKTTGTGATRRVIVIERADTMAAEAQNAILKTLEEPPLDTMILLTASQPEKLLPTIRSRAQLVHITPPGQPVAEEYFGAKGFTGPAVTKAYVLSAGMVGLMQAILENEHDNPLVQDIQAAKSLLQKTVFERLTVVDELSKQRERVTGLLTALKRICQGALEQAAQKQQTASVTSWHHRLQQTAEAEERFAKNANTKLLLTDLFLNL
jgi:DNA polymerase III delta prime subunit